MGKKNEEKIMGDQKAALKIAGIYLLFSVCWILFSDQILNFFVINSVILTKIQTIKGGAFVLITSALIFFYCKKRCRRSALPGKR